MGQIIGTDQAVFHHNSTAAMTIPIQYITPNPSDRDHQTNNGAQMGQGGNL